MLNVLISSCPDIIEVNFLVFFVVVKECVFSMCSMLCKLRSTFFLRSSLCFNKMLNNINHTNLQERFQTFLTEKGFTRQGTKTITCTRPGYPWEQRLTSEILFLAVEQAMFLRVPVHGRIDLFCFVFFAPDFPFYF